MSGTVKNTMNMLENILAASLCRNASVMSVNNNVSDFEDASFGVSFLISFDFSEHSFIIFIMHFFQYAVPQSSRPKCLTRNFWVIYGF